MENIQELDRRTARKVYLITYSRANPELCPTREIFSEMVIQSFNFARGQVRLLHWAVSKEPHEGGGYHFHMCICLSNNKRWGPVKEALAARGIVVNFQERNDIFNYVGAYLYVCKIDRDVLHSNPHPDLSNVTQYRTANASRANLRRGSVSQRSSRRVTKLTNLNVVQIIRYKGIKDDTSLFALAEENFNQGHTALMEFVPNTPERKYKELISKVWKVKNAVEETRLQNTTRMDKVREELLKSCVPECDDNRQWFTLAMDILNRNNVDSLTFAKDVRTLLKEGRKKGTNIIITGPRDCGKTFILRPLTKIFNCFTNPSSGTYAFVGLEKKEVAFLNDLRYSPVMIPWQDFLNLLEGMEVHISAPKTHYAEDIELKSDIPFFATSIGPVNFVGKSEDPAGENQMMATRWNIFKFDQVIKKEQQVAFPPCPRCFAELVLMGE